MRVVGLGNPAASSEPLRVERLGSLHTRGAGIKAQLLDFMVLFKF